MAALGVGSVLAPVLVAVVGVDAAFMIAGLALPVVALLVVGRIRTVDRDAVVADPTDVALLRGTPVFAPLGLASLERIARNLVPIEVAPGGVVIKEGDPGDRFYVIAEGAVEVSRGGETLAKLGAGDLFGEIALLRDVPRTATVVALEPTSLRALERAQFLAAVTGSPAGAVALSEEMDRRIAEHGS
jgi:hypothetical protein